MSLYTTKVDVLISFIYTRKVNQIHWAKEFPAILIFFFQGTRREAGV